MSLMTDVTIRRATPADAAEAGRICFEAFYKINTEHNFPPDIPAIEMAQGFIQMLTSHPGFFGVIAERDGKIVGSNFLDERNPIAGVGPITVDPVSQNSGAGRLLMQAVMERAAERKFAGVRLVQAAFHNRSLSLYTKLGFNVREPLSCVNGNLPSARLDRYTVRKATMDDVAACNELCAKVHGHDRGGELKDGVGQGTAHVVEDRGRVVAYTSALMFFGHSVAETNEGLQALIGAIPLSHPGILIPTRNGDLLRWCINHGLRVIEPMNLMATGDYSEPQGAFISSIAY